MTRQLPLRHSIETMPHLELGDNLGIMLVNVNGHRLSLAVFGVRGVDKRKGSKTTAACPADHCTTHRDLLPWPNYLSLPGSATPPPSCAGPAAPSPPRPNKP